MSKKSWPAPKPHPSTKREARRFDSTSLREGGVHGKYVHRDYAAHWFRWSYAVRFVRQGMRVLDVGCGPDVMMPKVLLHTLTTVPELYVGVDVDRIPKKPGIAWTRVFDEFDFTSRWKELMKPLLSDGTERAARAPGPFDLVTCFEAIEHMGVTDGIKLLQGIRGVLKPDGTALLSTPVYNEKHMAANHIHEYRFDELRYYIESVGLRVERVHGTFMTANAMKKVMTPDERKLVEELLTWYPWEVLANFLAPKYPQASSNCAWVLRRA
jgi:SAM-dependent methyltransferase